MKQKLIIPLILIISFISVCAYLLGGFAEPKIPYEETVEYKVKESLRKDLDKQKAHDNRPWQLKYYVDEFGDKTDSKYISTFTKGIFSNSATTKDSLYVYVNLSLNNLSINLHEYNLNRSPSSFIKTGRILLKNDHNYKEDFAVHSSGNKSGIKLLFNEDREKFLQFMKKSTGFVKVNIKDGYSSNYNFNINTNGFNDELKKLSNFYQ